MNINFYLNDEEETEITTLYNLEGDPFKIGDIINLEVTELAPMHIQKYKQDTQEKFIKNQEILRNNFRLKAVKIVRDYKTVTFNLLSNAKLTVDYYCEIVE